MKRDFELYKLYSIVSTELANGEKFCIDISNPLGKHLKKIKSYSILIGVKSAKKYIDTLTKNQHP
tara:strand:+ start:585 stop:779 length:195 start_codon:yes stop_codon:yes gene_type:complete